MKRFQLGICLIMMGIPIFAVGEEGKKRRGPPPHAYSDCKGKKAGDVVQHKTPEGVVPAKCEDSPEGLVARPEHRPPPDEDSPPPTQAPHSLQDPS